MARKEMLAAAGALALAVQPQAASAQSCLSEAELSALAIYAVPPALAGVQARCATVLPANGFLASGGAALASRYAALAPQSWPVARSALLELAGNPSSLSAEERQVFDTIRGLPDGAVRPVVDALIVEKLAETIKPESCSQIERGISLLASLEPGETGAIAAFVLSLTRPDELPICDSPQP